MSGPWHAGFLREPTQSRLGDLQALWPTLVVVDYAAQRSSWLSEAIFRLGQRRHGAPVRVLVLECAPSGPWWDTIQRLNRFEESRLVDAAAYAKPRELGGLSRDEIRDLIRDIAGQAGATPSTTDIEDIADHADHADHAERIDPADRPLFAVIAALDWLDGNGASGGRDTALRRLLARMDAQMAGRQAGSLPPGKARNLRTLATVLGGISAAEYERILQRLQPPSGLLPGVFDDYQQVSLDDLADGVRPDILGELYVLDRLATSPPGLADRCPGSRRTRSATAQEAIPMPKVGEKITVDVVARRFWNNTGLHVTVGQSYQFLAVGTWVDLYSGATPTATPRRGGTRRCGSRRASADCPGKTGSLLPARSVPGRSADTLLSAAAARSACRRPGSWRSLPTTCRASTGTTSARYG